MDAVFTRPTAACPECGLALRRNLYRAQQFEDPAVEREVDVRKKVLQELVKKGDKGWPLLCTQL